MILKTYKYAQRQQININFNAKDNIQRCYRKKYIEQQHTNQSKVSWGRIQIKPTSTSNN
jgi:hypothetical protein